VETVLSLREHVHSSFAGSIFNVDMISIQDWDYQKEKKNGSRHKPRLLTDPDYTEHREISRGNFYSIPVQLPKKKT
jgi:hypothetical protein